MPRKTISSSWNLMTDLNQSTGTEVLPTPISPEGGAVLLEVLLTASGIHRVPFSCGLTQVTRE